MSWNLALTEKPLADAAAMRTTKAKAEPLAFRILRPLASLKLTVALFAMSIFLVFAGTLAQKEVDVWVVIEQWFRIDERNFIRDQFPYVAPAAMVKEMFVEIPVQYFCIDLLWPSFLGTPPKTELTFWFPRGWLIGLLMAINLVAAHTVRFTVQARGARLWAGVGVIALGCLATYAAVQSGSSEGGVLGEAVIGWGTLWKLILTGVAATGFGLGVLATKLDRTRKLERIAASLSAAACIAAVVYALYYSTTYKDALIGPESMRILWQLLKGGLAGLVLLAGCVMVFKKRAGIVLLHGGIGLMFFYEVLVGTLHKESQMTIPEGRSMNWIQDVRSPELAIIRPGDKDDQVTTIPKRLLSVGSTISDEQLPYDLKIVGYVQNANVRRKGPFEPTKATAGAGLSRTIEVLEPSKGASSSGTVDLPAAFIEVLDKKNGGKSLGVYLAAVGLGAPQRLPDVDGKPCQIEMRFQREYKPYTITAKEVRADHYVASSRPKNYSSLVRVVDPVNNIDREELIKMNNPMRFSGETFYQSGYHEIEGERVTTLQVVDNAGWMLPYVSCMIVGVGMLAQFGGVLLRFLKRRQTADGAAGLPVVVAAHESSGAKSGKKARRERGEPTETAPPAKPARPWALPVAVCVVVAAFMGYAAKPMKVDERGMDLAAFAKLPLAADARVKPYDALARSTLSYFSHKQTFKFDPSDKDERSKPAIRWLLDVMTESPQANDYKVFRIENDDLVKVLGIEREEGLCYSWNQITGKRHAGARDGEGREQTELEFQIGLAREKLKKGETGPFERELGELEDRVSAYRLLTFAFNDPAKMLTVGTPDAARPEAFEERLGDASLRLLELMSNLSSVGEMSRKPALATPVDADKWETLVETNLRRFVNDPAHRGDADLLNERFGMMMQRMQEVAQSKDVDPQTLQRLGRWAEGALKYHRLVVDREQGKAAPPAAAKVSAVFDAYRSGDAAKFNAAVADYGDYLAANPPAGYDRRRTVQETFLLRWEPFFWCSYIYLTGAIVAAASWLGWSKPLNRTAWWLIAATFVVHTAAYILRMYVTERPPVVNLYSSALFIGWVAVFMMLLLESVYRNGIGNIIAAVSGYGSLQIAFLLTRQGDTIEALQAVLDTQFWLTTHVVCITAGYSATYLAGLLGMIYILLGVATPSLTRETGKDITRMIYGIVCFALFLSFIGTVLGGLWADDSWGRFWGWDPKENGALIIVLWNALLLHARWDGMIRERGLAVLAVAGNITTSWSWFGVNQLGVGLHAYGFSKELRMFLTFFVVSSLVTIVLGLLPKQAWWSRDKLEAA